MTTRRVHWLLVFAWLGLSACALHPLLGADAVAAWVGNNPAGSVLYVLQRQVNGAWVDVGSTATETLTLTAVTPGVWTVRVIATMADPDPAKPRIESPPSNVVTVTIGPNAPSVLTFTIK